MLDGGVGFVLNGGVGFMLNGGVGFMLNGGVGFMLENVSVVCEVLELSWEGWVG